VTALSGKNTHCLRGSLLYLHLGSSKDPELQGRREGGGGGVGESGIFPVLHKGMGEEIKEGQN
jgi:hypothetical protein